MSRIKPAINSPHSGEWLVPVGKLVINFAAIEMHTYLWLGDLSDDEQLPYQAVDWPFKRRVESVLSLVETEIESSEVKAKSSETWAQAIEIAKFRNAIVHNPVVFGWSGAEVGPPDVICIPDVGHLGSKPKVTKPVASIPEINNRCDQIVSVVTRLFELREQYLQQAEQ